MLLAQSDKQHLKSYESLCFDGGFHTPGIQSLSAARGADNPCKHTAQWGDRNKPRTSLPAFWQ